jgi:hypothetical protein
VGSHHQTALKSAPVDRPLAIVTCPVCRVSAGVGVDHGETVVTLSYPQFMSKCQCQPRIGHECPELEKAIEAATH